MPTLKDRLAALKAQHAKTAPSFVPRSKSRPKRQQEPPPPDVRALIDDAEELTEFYRLAAEHAAYGSDERALAKEKAPITERIKVLCNNYGVRKAMVDDLKLAYYMTAHKSISVELLLQHGVSPAVIKACTVTNESWRLMITPPGVSEDEED